VAAGDRQRFDFVLFGGVAAPDGFVVDVDVVGGEFDGDVGRVRFAELGIQQFAFGSEFGDEVARGEGVVDVEVVGGVDGEARGGGLRGGIVGADEAEVSVVEGVVIVGGAFGRGAEVLLLDPDLAAGVDRDAVEVAEAFVAESFAGDVAGDLGDVFAFGTELVDDGVVGGWFADRGPLVGDVDVLIGRTRGVVVNRDRGP
jgi:hypothetical protein